MAFLHYATILCCKSFKVHCITRGPLGCSHTMCHPRLEKWIYTNHFSDMTLTLQSEGVTWTCDFAALHYQCRSRNLTGLLKKEHLADVHGTHKKQEGFAYCQIISIVLLLVPFHIYAVPWPFLEFKSVLNAPRIAYSLSALVHAVEWQTARNT